MLAELKPPGVMLTLLNVIYLPASIPWLLKLTVTVADPLTVSKVAVPVN